MMLNKQSEYEQVKQVPTHYNFLKIFLIYKGD
jgi:hypothetical protein